MLAGIVAIGSFVGLIISLLLLVWQTRISNNVAGAAVMQATFESVGAVLKILVERPELRKYVYDNKPCPSAGLERDRILALVELLADALEGGLVATRRVRASESFEDWLAYSDYMLKCSPTLAFLVAEHPGWWPGMAEILTSASVAQPLPSP